MPHADPAGRAAAAGTLLALEAAEIDCFACPRLVAWRETVAIERVARFRDQAYWGRPVPGFGDEAARILLVGLAPAAHGGNRTGRVFTGDASGDFLFHALHAVGLANKATSRRVDDGLALRGVRVAAAVRCAPPANKPTPEEQETCRPYLVRELALLPDVRVLVALGAIGWDAALRTLDARGVAIPRRPRPAFAHGAEVTLGDHTLVGTYHPSQQNTFTGKLTLPMLQDVLQSAKSIAGIA
jgi:uracil-DNA glycosylase